MNPIAAILLELSTVEVTTREHAQTLEDVIRKVIEHDKKLQDRLHKLTALEAAGVDNWEGYDIAMRTLYGSEDEDESDE